ncbi:unnamed protein product [Periconia digitata]|uniref:NAD(P)-binding protein n=1 Tax=Periconia digitata TaxID=1303443 RepID=A0A9W4UIG1_9PLEO|nr:unnamed protein product [Periconia digitata]
MPPPVLSTLPKGRPLVLALIGATSGIGSYTARALCRTFASNPKKLRVYLVGRNASRAASILEYAKEVCPGSEWVFLEVEDLALMSEVDDVARRIEEAEEKKAFWSGEDEEGMKTRKRLDGMWLCQALSPMQESRVTKEGLDTQLSLLYYSRIHLIQKLIPLLISSPHPSHVISIFAGGYQDRISTTGPPPIGTPSPKAYGMTSVRTNVVFMKTFLFEELASKYAGKISFTHIYPGLVDGPTFYSVVNPWWARMLWRVIMKPLLSWYMTSAEVCGDVMVGLLDSVRYPPQGGSGGKGEMSTRAEPGDGAYGVGQRGDASGKVMYEGIRKEDTGKRVWEHTMGVFEEIDK